MGRTALPVQSLLGELIGLQALVDGIVHRDGQDDGLGPVEKGLQGGVVLLDGSFDEQVQGLFLDPLPQLLHVPLLQVDGDVGVQHTEFADDLREDEGAEKGGAADRQISGIERLDVLKVVLEVFLQQHDLFDGLNVKLTLPGQGKGDCAPVKDGAADLLLAFFTMLLRAGWEMNSFFAALVKLRS